MKKPNIKLVLLVLILVVTNILLVTIKHMPRTTKLPITVKTRLGWDHDSIRIVEVAERLQDVGCKAIAIHGRTCAQMYKGQADWKPIAEVKNNPRMHIPVFGNGDVDMFNPTFKYLISC